MQTLLTAFIVLGVLVLVWGFALAGLGYAARSCRRLIGRLSERQHSS
jgi:hypothetical protein